MIRKALHIVLAAVVLISTTGIIINMHFCHDSLIDIALYSPAESCCDTNMEALCDHQEGLSQMDHCNDASIFVEALEDFVGSSFSITFENNQYTDLLFWVALQYSPPGINEVKKSIVPEYYLPPPYQEVDLSQIQSYLI